MATIYNKNGTDKTLIIGPREQFLRQMNIGSWNEIRIGFYFSFVSLSDNVNAGPEVVSISTPNDNIYVGIKNSDNQIVPGFYGSSYIGMMPATGRSSSTNSGDSWMAGGVSGGSLAAGAYKDTIRYSGSQDMEIYGQRLVDGGGASNLTAYCGVFAIRYILNNSGSANQNIGVSTIYNNPSINSTYTISDLRPLINNVGYYGATKLVPWYPSYAIPDGFYIRNPFTNNRIRISALMAIKYS